MWLLPVAIVLLLAFTWRSTGDTAGGCCGGHAHQQEPDALEILRQRYARGEVSQEEFEERRRNLG